MATTSFLKELYGMQYSFGAYRFDPARYALTHMGKSVPLRPQGV